MEKKLTKIKMILKERENLANNIQPSKLEESGLNQINLA